MLRTIQLLAFFAPAILFSQVKYEAVELDLGVGSEDYAPLPVDGGFIMSSLREAPGMVDVRNADSGKPLAE